MRKLFFVIALLAVGLFLAGQAQTHTPLCSCYDNGDGTITCEGGFSDGSSGAGVLMKVVDKTGKVLVEGKMDEYSEFTFKKPDTPYKVIFDAGPGHVVEVKGEDITQ
jgi:hypothetical protein